MLLLEIAMWAIIAWFVFLAFDLIYQVFADSWKHRH